MELHIKHDEDRSLYALKCAYYIASEVNIPSMIMHII